jgi:hypothetical protein
LTSIERRLDLLEAQLPPANGHSDSADPVYEIEKGWARLCKLFQWHNLRFTAPDHVEVANWIGTTSPNYSELVDTATHLSRQLAAQPGTLFFPLTTRQAVLAQAALDAALLSLDESNYSGRSIHRARNWQVRYPSGLCKEIPRPARLAPDLEHFWQVGGLNTGVLALCLDRAVDCAVVQLRDPLVPDGPPHKSLEFLADLLEWHRYHNPSDEDEA